jgi:hypothetical protein
MVVRILTTPPKERKTKKAIFKTPPPLPSKPPPKHTIEEAKEELAMAILVEFSNELITSINILRVFKWEKKVQEKQAHFKGQKGKDKKGV